MYTYTYTHTYKHAHIHTLGIIGADMHMVMHMCMQLLRCN